MSHIFYFLGVPEGDKPRLAARQLEGSALNWWEGMRDRKRIDRASWEEFVELFEEEFLPSSVKWEKWTKFSRLHQGPKTVAEYEQEFRDLSRYAPETVATEELRIKKFISGLRWAVRDKVEHLHHDSYSAVVDSARVAERCTEERRPASQGTPRPGGSDRTGGFKKPRVEQNNSTQKERSHSFSGLSRFSHGFGKGITFKEYPEGCGCCGEKGHFKRECPMSHLSCNICGARGHLAKV